ncbi:MAG: hypothetical protein ABI780_10905, partial [Ardenticatenales bacterium]
NQNGQVQQSAQEIDMSATNAMTLVGTKSSPIRQMSQKGWGGAAAYRPSNDPAKVGKIYVIGGAKTDLDYTKFAGTTPPANYIVEGEDTIFEYDIDADSWTAITGAGALGNRLFPSAAYSPDADAILVVGGMKDCDFVGAIGTKSCSPDTLQPMWLTFDKTTGDVSGLAPAESGGPSKIYGQTSVYDATHKWIITYGGTSTGSNADRKAWALDMSGATPAWKNLPDAPKALAFHSAAYDSNHMMMVTHGGVSSSFFKSNEGFSTATYGLDLTDPAAPKWSDLGAGGLNPSERIGGVMNFVSNPGGLMNVVMSTGRRKLPSTLTSSQTVSKNNDVLDCTVGVPTTPPATTTTPPPSATTPGGGTATPVPTSSATPDPKACPGLETKAPAAAINAAVANAAQVSGYGMACNPNTPWNPVSNPLRNYLSLRNVNVPYHPVYNGFIWKCGCP